MQTLQNKTLKKCFIASNKPNKETSQGDVQHQSEWQKIRS